MSEKAYRLTIGTILPPVIAALIIWLFASVATKPKLPHENYSWVALLVLVLGLIPSFLYSLAMEHVVKPRLTEDKSKGAYLFMSAMLGGCASSIPFFGPWVIIGIIIGLCVGRILMKSVVRESAISFFV